MTKNIIQSFDKSLPAAIDRRGDDNSSMTSTALSVRTVSLNIGMILHYPKAEYAIINVTPEYVTLCKTKVNEFDIHIELVSDILLAIATKKIDATFNQPLIVDPRQLPEQYRQAFFFRKNLILRVVSQYGPDYLIFNKRISKKMVDDLSKEAGVSRRTLRNWVLCYLQSGLSEFSLLDKRWQGKAGRPTQIKLAKPNEFSSYFDEAIEIYRHGHGEIKLTDAYEIIYRRYFCTHAYENGMFTSTPINDREIPSYWSFYRYYRNKISKEEQDKIVMGPMEQRNNKRILTGSADTGVSGPYDICEMDAWESNFDLRNENGEPVGSAVVYMIKDVATRMIVAISVAFDNNSIIGCTNCIANLNEDKQSLLANYGLKMPTKYSWLTGYKPRAIRIDNGADFISDQVLNIFNELSITPMIVSPGMGSYKGVVERSFRDIRETIGMFLLENGYSTGRHGEKPHKEALLTIKQFTKLIYAYVIAYNESINSGIAITSDMTENNIPKVPARVMEYYFGFHIPQHLPVGDDFLRVLLSEGTATITKDGLKFSNLFYFDEKDTDLRQHMYSLQTSSGRFNILYDPRSVNMIYYVKDGTLHRVPLNLKKSAQNSYKNKTFAQVAKEFAATKKSTQKAEEDERNQKTNLMFTAAKIINEAVDENPNYCSSTKNIRESREIAKQEWSANNMALDKRLGSGFTDLPNYDANLPEPSSEREESNTFEPKDYSGLSPIDRVKAITGDILDNDEDEW